MIASTQDTTKPFIRGAYDIEVELGSDFDPLDGVVAVDNEDGDITENIKKKAMLILLKKDCTP